MDKIYNIALKQFNNKPLTDAEQAMLNQWLAEDKHQAIFNDLKLVWQLTGNLSYEITPNLNEEWASFKNIRDNRKIKKVNRKNNRWIAVAASIAVLIGIFGGIVFFYQTPEQVYASNNKSLHVTLPDSSQVWLNKNSSLVLAKSFARKNRNVLLTGEGFFQVARNERVPFVIKTGKHVYTRVLGTQFNLRAYPDEPVVELQVVSGKVQFGEANKNHTIVEKNHTISYNLENNQLSEPVLLNANLISWKTQKFNFDNAKLLSVIEVFERYFSKDIKLPKASEELRFSGDFTAPTDKDFAEVLAVAFNWDYKIDTDKIIFIKK